MTETTRTLCKLDIDYLISLTNLLGEKLEYIQSIITKNMDVPQSAVKRDAQDVIKIAKKLNETVNILIDQS